MQKFGSWALSRHASVSHATTARVRFAWPAGVTMFHGHASRRGGVQSIWIRCFMATQWTRILDLIGPSHSNVEDVEDVERGEVPHGRLARVPHADKRQTPRSLLS